MRMLLAEASSVVNGKWCAREFSLDQWVIDPRHGAGERGDAELAGHVRSTEDRADPKTIFCRKDGIGSPGKERVHTCIRDRCNRDESQKINGLLNNK